jgi:hypothetical protein
VILSNNSDPNLHTKTNFKRDILWRFSHLLLIEQLGNVMVKLFSGKAIFLHEYEV